MCCEADVSESQLRIPLGDCCLVCEGFRQRVAGRPSLEVDGDLLWALEHSGWQPLAVALEPLADGARVRPLPLERQSAFDAQRVLDWRDDEVRIACLPAVHDARALLDWCRARWPGAAFGAEALDAQAYAWGRLLRLDCRRAGLAVAGHEHFLLPHAYPCVYLGHLALDWRRLRFEPNA